MNVRPLTKDEKYFFNQNIFDDAQVDAEIAAPTYAAKDLEDARRRGFTEGQDHAHKQQEDSRAKRIEQTLDLIKSQIMEMIAAEKNRADLYQTETLNLTMLIFKKLFPLYEKAAGFAELKEYLARVFAAQEDHPHINIFVSPAIANEIRDYMGELKTEGTDISCVIIADEKLAEGASLLSWSDGGALRNPEKLAHDIETAINDILAAHGTKGHDDKNENGENS